MASIFLSSTGHCLRVWPVTSRELGSPSSAVLPMGFKNSVALAQHVHKGICKGAMRRVGTKGGVSRASEG